MNESAGQGASCVRAATGAARSKALGAQDTLSEGRECTLYLEKLRETRVEEAVPVQGQHVELANLTAPATHSTQRGEQAAEPVAAEALRLSAVAKCASPEAS
eukprot:9837001-Lingulodinium_polyedra.AAC.1